MDVGALSLTRSQQTSTGPYRDLVADAVLTPPAGGDVRRFTLGYDVVLDQVVTHTVLVSVRQDWAAGAVGEDAASEVGVIRTDTRTMRVAPLKIDLADGGWWTGFTAMLRLGGHHILEGTDHLLFLLVLLLPAAQVVSGRRWTGRRWTGRVGTRQALGRIGRITLAFTVGHSVTLALSALTDLDLPARPVEALIAVSILIGAAHAIRPLFPGREALVAGGFGLVHGMAFAFTLAELHLSLPQLVLSLIGFNLGIELLQLLVVALVLPSLLILARTRAYPAVRTFAALAAGIAALGWLADRLGVPNPIADAADATSGHGVWVIAGLAALAITTMAPRPWSGSGIRLRRSTPPDRPPIEPLPDGFPSAATGRS